MVLINGTIYCIVSRGPVSLVTIGLLFDELEPTEEGKGGIFILLVPFYGFSSNDKTLVKRRLRINLVESPKQL